MSNYYGNGYYNNNKKQKGGGFGIFALTVLIIVLAVIGAAALLSLRGGDSLLKQALNSAKTITPEISTAEPENKTQIPQKTEQPQPRPESTQAQAKPEPAKTPAKVGSYDDITGRSVSDIISGSDSPVIKVAEKVTPGIVGISNLVSFTNRDGSSVDVQQSTGSGMILDKEGYIATNQHVVSGAHKLTVVLFDGSEYEAELIGQDERTDVAVIKLVNCDKELSPVTLGESSSLMVGQLAVAIGNPMGEQLAGSVTFGCISGVDREMKLDDGRILRFIQTDAAISSGNSGGALVNMAGEVIGINNMKAAGGAGSVTVEGISFAIPIDTAKVVIEQLIETGHVKRPGIGITGYDLSAANAAYYNVPQGPLVSEVHEGGGAKAAGIKPNDIITHVNGQRVLNFNEMKNVLESFITGDTVSVTVFREGETIEFSVTLSQVEQ